MSEKPVGVPEIAAFLDVSEYTVREYAKAGVVPGHKLGRQWRFFPSEVRARLTETSDPWALPSKRGR